MKGSAAFFSGLIIATSAHASGPVTYVCIEERSVGWEGREGAADFVGQFQPDTAPMAIKFYPAEIENEKVKALAKIEVTEDGKTDTLTSNACSITVNEIIQNRLFGTEHDVDWYLRGCALRLENSTGMVGFGSDNHRFAFTKDPGARQSPIQYTESLIVGLPWAYVHRGTCTLAQ